MQVILYLPPGSDWELTVNGTGFMSGTDFGNPRDRPGCRLEIQIDLDGSGSFGCEGF